MNATRPGGMVRPRAKPASQGNSMTIKFRRRFLGLSLFLSVAFAFVVTPSSPATAHPHVWIDMRTALQFDDEGRLTALTVAWTFDEFYSAFAVDGFEKKNGDYDPALLTGLTDVNLSNLKEWNYFTEIKQNGTNVATEAPSGKMTWNDESGRLTLTFSLPLAEPIAATADAPLTFRVYDPSYYISIDYVEENPVQLTGGNHKSCKIMTETPTVENVWTTLPEASFTDSSAQYGAYFAAITTLTCS